MFVIIGVTKPEIKAYFKTITELGDLELIVDELIRKGAREMYMTIQFGREDTDTVLIRQEYEVKEITDMWKIRDKAVRVINCSVCQGLRILIDDLDHKKFDDCSFCEGVGKVTIIQTIEIRPYKPGDENE